MYDEEEAEDELPLGEQVRFRKFDDPVRVAAEKELRRQYEDGASLRRLSDNTGLSYWTVREALLRVGTVLRAEGGVAGELRAKF